MDIHNCTIQSIMSMRIICQLVCGIDLTEHTIENFFKTFFSIEYAVPVTYFVVVMIIVCFEVCVVFYGVFYPCLYSKLGRSLHAYWNGLWVFGENCIHGKRRQKYVGFWPNKCMFYLTTHVFSKQNILLL